MKGTLSLSFKSICLFAHFGVFNLRCHSHSILHHSKIMDLDLDDEQFQEWKVG